LRWLERTDTIRSLLLRKEKNAKEPSACVDARKEKGLRPEKEKAIEVDSDYLHCIDTLGV